ncbi:CapA family protein [Neobacillus notoginsengisoli]|uniref:CapA family protein n=1 Tax=Neobacillus notoginsengisoli TaxID=1578198 RepID=A0A417YX94_9BACI|nr:CapA family protein [Neobacillus notoginsengisoli]RHW42149.1 CapA family protein [Neobacillus notoginsengisoli]
MKEYPLFKTIAVIGALSLTTLLAACTNGSETESRPVPKSHADRPFEVQGKSIKESLTIGAIGDILIHDLVYEDAKSSDGYNFNPMFEPVKDLLQAPDILTANQESLVGGTELGISSYPSFNSPFELSEAVINSGVDIVSTANNHSLDKGYRGVEKQIAYFEKISLPYVGTAVSQEGRDKVTVLKKNGIRLAFLSYTYGTNGIPIPQGKAFSVNLIDRELMKKDIAKARQESDVVIASMHWGNEYQRYPTDEQKDLAKFLAGEGVDIIFGSHPHVLQPMEWIERSDGKKTFVVYSLGNFISAQVRDYKDIGGLVTLEITKTISEKGTTVELANPSFHPTFVYRKNGRNFRVVPMEKTGAYGISTPEQMTLETIEHMTQWLR